MTPELGQLLSSEFGLNIQNGRKIVDNTRLIDRYPILLEKERTIAQELKRVGHTKYLLDPEGQQFTAALGKGSVLVAELNIGSQSTRPEVFATVTPDTSLEKKKLRIAFLGRMSNQGLWIPQHLRPDTAGFSDDVKIYLSGANELGTVGDHSPQVKITIVDPRHLFNAMGEANSGSLANKLIEDANPNQRSHLGDVWEKERKLLPFLSAQNPQSAKEDLIEDPITFLPELNFQNTYGVTIKLYSHMVDPIALENDQVIPFRADQDNALASLQEMGFATLIRKKGAVDNLTRLVSQRMV